MMKTFVDIHCHVFNAVDIPLYLTLADKVNMGTLQRFKLTAGALVYLPVVLASKKVAEKKLTAHQAFIEYFERSIKRNIQYLLDDIRASINLQNSLANDTNILITPLIMDFDYLLMKENSSQVGKEPSVKEQYRRHFNAITSDLVKDIANAKICPFIGFDLRKLSLKDKNRLLGFKAFWKNNTTLGKQDVDSLQSGKLLGIKLYPPIGFNPCPNDLHPNYKEFYSWCCTEDIPITTHCQTGSYSAGKEKNNIDKNTTPENWKRLLECPAFNKLRINFAHFGGETGTDDMFEPFRIDKDSWTYILIELLKKYPNTYSDISAYDYSKKEHRKNLLTIFEKDAAGDFGEGFALVDKLLWGSDVPMVISDKAYKQGYDTHGKSSYNNYVGSFINTISKSQKLSTEEKAQIIENLTEKNPLKFLRIGE